MSKLTVPFTYLIGWTQHDLYYYGVKHADGCHPNDLWKTYFTSSEYVKSTRTQLGEPDIIQVRKTFSDKMSASKWENRVLKRLKIFENNKFLNKQVNGNWVMDEETKKKISITSKGKSKPAFTKEHKNNLRLAHTGKIVSDETKQKLKTVTQEYWNNVKAGLIERKMSKKPGKPQRVIVDGIEFRTVREACSTLKKRHPYVKKNGIYLNVE